MQNLSFCSLTSALLLGVWCVSIPVFAQAPQPVSPAAQDSEARLREGLRNAIGQARALEDERARLQARVTKAEADATKLRADNIEFDKKLKELRKIREEERKEFEKRIADRDETLGKWKDAYTEAATLARTKEAERVKLDAEVKSLTPSLKTCQTRNKELVTIGKNLATRLDGVDLAEILERKEPVFGFHKTDVENEVQDYRNKIIDRREKPAPKK